MDIKEIRELTGLNQTDFAKKYNIPSELGIRYPETTGICSDAAANGGGNGVFEISSGL